MKKQLLLFTFSALALTSCKDDNLEAYEMDIMKGDWKEVKREIISGKDNKTVLQSYPNTGCAAKNTLFFRTDYYVSYTAFTGTGADCQMDQKSEGRYTYDADSKVLGIKLGDEEASANYRVDVLTNKELRLAQQFGNFDLDGDKIPEVTYVTYKR
ncbi:Lipocalin-like domain-containing protein [Chryseobacterium rhizoplanae]|uniref:Lipocalin-like domain-containing protein n=1 Tax=Chryseobacterium rhizoplanae TaxID=1609531 RepID=A0A521AJ61_9FLAO|nr:MULTISPECIES: lipocalin family protein [Chryseobacterium]SMO34720.1 Lipocalin-like domain-containing protein [Chryseobacterium rhizoplanae]